MMFATYQKLSDSLALCSSGADKVVEGTSKTADKAETKKKTSAQWGPSHSFESDEDEKTKSSSWWRPSLSSAAAAMALTPTKPTTETNGSTPATDSTKSSESSPKEAPPPTQSASDFAKWATCQKDTTTTNNSVDLDFCTRPCQPVNLESTFGFSNNEEPEPVGLGICRLEPPNCNATASLHTSAAPLAGSTRGGPIEASDGTCQSVNTTETPADRRRQRHHRRQERNRRAIATVESKRTRSLSPHEDFEVTPTQVLSVPPQPRSPQKSPQRSKTRNKGSDKKGEGKQAPFDSFTLDKSSALEMERSISELTMRSSYGVATSKISESRRMAYYAVGKHHRQSGRGGNRRCYFTGKLILSGAPFYAGSVQQGLRTLVVFCLPSSLGLPKGQDHGTTNSVLASLDGSGARSVGRFGMGSRTGILGRNRSRASKMSSVDEISLSVGEELDPNWGLDKNYLLSVLPDVDQGILDEMARRFPQQFETLPVQVRGPHCWRLYVKFCFFSGLPIAEGEMHYKVRDEVSDTFGEEVILSHEVMEAVNGHDSAEILKLPNLKTFKYLRKHYNQQSAKLPDSVFQRQSWEMVRPEV